MDCTGCGTPVANHCPSSNCTWYRCPNTKCDHDTYDPSRGILRYRSGRIERLGATS